MASDNNIVIKRVLAGGAVATALAAVWALWIQIGGPVPVTEQTLYETASGLENKILKVESDGKAHSEESAKWGRKIYNQELHDLLMLPPPKGTEQQQYWKESIEDAKRQRKFYSDKEIELRKE